MSEIVDDLFSELAPPRTEDNSGDAKKTTTNDKDGRKVLARAFGIEITIDLDSNIRTSPKLQSRIDKLLSDVALALKYGDNEESANADGMWYCSSRGNEAEDESVRSKRAPAFTANFSNTLSDMVSLEQPANGPGECSRAVITTTCFNCEGSHTVAECPEPRNEQKIRKNRLLYRQKVSVTQTGRYHREKEERFNKYVPGVISDGLKNALGLRPWDLPPWIYEMRILGYPPGYFQKLVNPAAKLVIYNEQNDGVNEKPAETQFDASSVVEYPGFNVPLPEGVRDESRQRRYPPMLPQHSKEAFLAGVASINGLKNAQSREGRVKTGHQPTKRTGSPLDVVDITDNNVRGSATADKRRGKRGISPSVEELEEKRQTILAELGEKSSSKRQRLSENAPAAGECSSSLQDFDVDLVSPESPTSHDVEVQPAVVPKVIPLNESSLCATSGTSTSQSLSVDAGTPIHDSFLKGSKPQLDKFADGITPFSPSEENISQNPKYQSLKKILSRNRK